MEILVVSGFLGAGKTTFIKNLIERVKEELVVYENEYGQADIDTQLIQESGDINIWEATENCVCCTGKSDFASAILTISGSLDPKYLIVEPTGVAKLSNVLQNIKKIQYDRIQLLKPVVIIDGTLFYQEKEKYKEIYKDQIVTAERIIVTRMEFASAKEKTSLAQAIKHWNPKGEILMDSYKQQDISWWQSLFTQTIDKIPEREKVTSLVKKPQRKEENLETYAMDQISIPTPTHLICFLNAMAGKAFGDITRAKGYFPCGQEWIRFDFVEQTWQITGTTPKEAPNVVFIGKKINKPAIQEVITASLSGE